MGRIRVTVQDIATRMRLASRGESSGADDLREPLDWYKLVAFVSRLGADLTRSGRLDLRHCWELYRKMAAALPEVQPFDPDGHAIGSTEVSQDSVARILAQAKLAFAEVDRPLDDIEIV